jgi:hypothetical protein
MVKRFRITAPRQPFCSAPAQHRRAGLTVGLFDWSCTHLLRHAAACALLDRHILLGYDERRDRFRLELPNPLYRLYSPALDHGFADDELQRRAAETDPPTRRADFAHTDPDGGVLLEGNDLVHRQRVWLQTSVGRLAGRVRFFDDESDDQVQVADLDLPGDERQLLHLLDDGELLLELRAALGQPVLASFLLDASLERLSPEQPHLELGPSLHLRLLGAVRLWRAAERTLGAEAARAWLSAADPTVGSWPLRTLALEGSAALPALAIGLRAERTRQHPNASPDPEQAWFWTPAWQAMEAEAEAEIAAGQLQTFDSAEALIAYLDRSEETVR